MKTHSAALFAFLRHAVLPAVLAIAFFGGLPLVGVATAQAHESERIDIEAVQGVLAVRSLDGWLLSEAKGHKGMATELVIPGVTTKRHWFYFIPASGQPMILVHKSDTAAFVNVPGKKVEYRSFRDLKAGLRILLRGVQTVAMEYAPNSGIASLTRVDAATVRLVRSAGVRISSSAALVQFTKSLWRPKGRESHYTAVHHLTKLRDEVLDLIRQRIRNNQPLSDLDVTRLLMEGYRVRGLEGSYSVAIGESTAKPNYVAQKRASTPIKRDDLIILRLSAKMVEGERPIYSSISWVAYVGETVPERYHRVFAVVASARDATISFLRSRANKRRLVRGFEADQKARQRVGTAGLASRFLHPTGHSLDTSLRGDGANLDDYDSHDTRNLVVGSGFTVGPGIYMSGDFGIQTVADVFMVAGGIEVTTPLQSRITPLLL